jgi:hypothetical protein
VIVPGFYNIRISAGHIHLAEFHKKIRIIRPKDLRQSASFVRNDVQLFNFRTLNEFRNALASHLRKKQLVDIYFAVISNHKTISRWRPVASRNLNVHSDQTIFDSSL